MKYTNFLSKSAFQLENAEKLWFGMKKILGQSVVLLVRSFASVVCQRTCLLAFNPVFSHGFGSLLRMTRLSCPLLGEPGERSAAVGYSFP